MKLLLQIEFSKEGTIYETYYWDASPSCGLHLWHKERITTTASHRLRIFL